MKEDKSQSILIIDGHSIINRAYYATAGRAGMTAPDSRPTGAVFGFLNIYLRFLTEYEPDKVCVCFDVSGKTFRHDSYPEYKEGRKPSPPELKVQIPMLKEVLDTMGIARTELQGFEADDLIGSVSAMAEQKGWKSYILSGDRDTLQLVSDLTTVLVPSTKAGQPVTGVFDVQAMRDTYSVDPKEFINVKGLMGDSSDNIPGVRGIGEKGATKLIATYGSLENIYENLDEIKGATHTKLAEHKDMAFLSRELSKIKRDLDVEAVFEEMESLQEDRQALYKLFSELGFKSFISRLDLHEFSDLSQDGSSDNAQNAYKTELVPVSKEIFASWKSSKAFKFPAKAADSKTVFDAVAEETYLTDAFKGLFHEGYKNFVCLYSTEAGKDLLDLGDDRLYLLTADLLPDFFDFLKKEKLVLAGYGLKDFLRPHFEAFSDKIDNLHLYDLGVAAYLLDNRQGEMAIDLLMERILAHENFLFPYFEEEQPAKQQSLFDTQGDKSENDLADRDLFTLSHMGRAVLSQTEDLIDRKLIYLALFVEMPLVRILSEMEYTGIQVDRVFLTELSDRFTEHITETEKIIFDLADEKFNVNSPKQLGDILFEKLKLPAGRKGKTGYSTNAQVLEDLMDMHPIIPEIVRFRELSKLKSTFVDGLAKSIDSEDGRVHTTFHQTLTATGRLSSSNPNIQNIPIRTETGREIRKAFTAGEGKLLVDADYSQIELRLLADFSQDEKMRELFNMDEDIHMTTAMEIFQMPREVISPEMRGAGKTINFSIVYGIGDFSLAKDLEVTVAQAHQYIESYHRRYPAVKPYFEALIEQAKEKGYVETIYRRRRYIDELRAVNRNLVQFGQRAAMNAPLQGTAADIIKIAMVLLDGKIRKDKLPMKLLLQVHDELIVEADESFAKQAEEILRGCMESATRLSLPLTAEVETKKSWY